MPILRADWTGPHRRQLGNPDQESALLQVLGRLHEGRDSRGTGTADPQTARSVDEANPMKPSSQAAISAASNREPDATRFARYGLAILRPILRALEMRGIYCHLSVSIEHQHLAKRYVLRATESGGAVADMGRYLAYLNADGTPLPWLHPIVSLSGNGRHAIVIAPELIRIEMLRIGHTYEMAISRHSLVNNGSRVRRVISSTLLFRGNQGTLAID